MSIQDGGNDQKNRNQQTKKKQNPRVSLFPPHSFVLALYKLRFNASEKHATMENVETKTRICAICVCVCAKWRNDLYKKRSISTYASIHGDDDAFINIKSMHTEEHVMWCKATWDDEEQVAKCFADCSQSFVSVMAVRSAARSSQTAQKTREFWSLPNSQPNRIFPRDGLLLAITRHAQINIAKKGGKFFLESCCWSSSSDFRKI